MVKSKSEATTVFDRLIKHSDVQSECSMISEYLEVPVWFAAVKANGAVRTRVNVFKNSDKKCRISDVKAGELIKKARRRRAIVWQRDRKRSRSVMCYPVMQGNQLYGYFLCSYNSLRDLPDLFMRTFQYLIDSIIRNIQKERELVKICDTIRPRAIALSTVHTVHRLISSTLKIDELIPRIARLTLQIMRADRCGVMLFDRFRKNLDCSALVTKESGEEHCLPLKGEEKAAKFVSATGKISHKDRLITVPLIDEDIIGVLQVSKKRSSPPFSEAEREILLTLSEQAAIAIKNANLYSDQEEILIGSVKSLAALMGAKRVGGPRLLKSMTAIGLAIADSLSISEETKRGLQYAILLHDASHITVPDEILSKPAELTGEEFDIIKSRTSQGVKIIEPLKALKPAMPIILHHHERYDGKGYPEGLKGGEIPVGSRIMAVVCAFEAMLTSRPYRSAKTIDEALEEIVRGRNVQFCPQVVDAFVAVISDKKIRNLLKREIKQNERE